MAHASPSSVKPSRPRRHCHPRERRFDPACSPPGNWPWISEYFNEIHRIGRCAGAMVLPGAGVAAVFSLRAARTAAPRRQPFPRAPPRGPAAGPRGGPPVAPPAPVASAPVSRVHRLRRFPALALSEGATGTMCGILGALGIRGLPEVNRRDILRRSRLLRHRGPDQTGVYESEDGSTFLAFERLMVVDPTDGGKCVTLRAPATIPAHRARDRCPRCAPRRPSPASPFFSAGSLSRSRLPRDWSAGLCAF